MDDVYQLKQACLLSSVGKTNPVIAWYKSLSSVGKTNQVIAWYKSSVYQCVEQAMLRHKNNTFDPFLMPLYVSLCKSYMVCLLVMFSALCCYFYLGYVAEILTESYCFTIVS